MNDIDVPGPLDFLVVECQADIASDFWLALAAAQAPITNEFADCASSECPTCACGR